MAFYTHFYLIHKSTKKHKHVFIKYLQAQFYPYKQEYEWASSL